MTRRILLSLSILALTIFAINPVNAQVEGSWSKEYSLDATSFGLQLGCEGSVELSGFGRLEEFGLRVCADLPDGHFLIVSAETKTSKRQQIGAIRLFKKCGSLVLNNSQQISPIFPLGELRTVMLHDVDGMIASVALNTESR